MVSRILFFSMVVAIVNAATWMGRLPQKPKDLVHKQGCYVKEINDVIPFGDSVAVEGQCFRVECSRHMIYYASCGKVSTDDPKCYVTDYDQSREYPECCPDVKCDIDNNLI